MSENKEWEAYLSAKANIYQKIQKNNYANNLISEANWVLRGLCGSGEDCGISVKVGDICYLDYGQSYLNEMGYQHFGIVMAIYYKKALIIPMTSNTVTYQKAYDEKDNVNGKRNLMRIGAIKGLNKPSVLFMNDMRFVNTARIIRIQDHISTRSALFKCIQERMKEMISI